MTRLELYHNKKPLFSLKGLFFIILILFISFFVVRYYYFSTIKIKAPTEDLGKKVIVHLPSGQKVYTYDNLIVEKNGKTYYKGEQNTIDLTGGTFTYKNWK